jgi:hypothetical protein
MCGDWKVRFEVLVELNVMVVFWPKYADPTTNKKEYCSTPWF